MTLTTQRGLGIALVLALVVPGCLDNQIFRTPAETEESARKAIRALGGAIARDEAAEGKPIIAVNLSGTLVTDADLKELKGLNKLKTLLLIQTRRVTDVGLKELKALNGLRELRLDGTQVTDAGLKELAGLTQLEKLGLSSTKVTDAGLKELKGLNGLRELRLGFTKVTDAGLKELQGRDGLQRLGLASTQVTDAGLKSLKGFKGLQELRLDGTQVTDAGLKELRNLKNLQQLYVADTKVTNAGKNDLQAAFPALKIVPVRLQGEIKSIEFKSKALGATRGVKVYLPPGHDPNKSYPVVYAADGFDGVAVELVEPLVMAGKIPPCIIVGTDNGGGAMRPREYLPGVSPQDFDAHDRFFCQEVIPWAEKEWGASRKRGERAVYGSSNSGPFALMMANLHPELFGHVFAMMVYGLPFKDFEQGLKGDPKAPTRYILVVGSQDAHGREENRRVEAILRKKNLPVVSQVIEGGGHSHELQREQFPKCMETAFGVNK